MDINTQTAGQKATYKTVLPFCRQFIEPGQKVRKKTVTGNFTIQQGYHLHNTDVKCDTAIDVAQVLISYSVSQGCTAISW